MIENPAYYRIDLKDGQKISAVNCQLQANQSFIQKINKPGHSHF